MSETTVGIIGGTGLYSLDGLAETRTIELDTPYGSPTSPITSGKLGNVRLLFIARHGIGHTYLPSEVNYRANIFALKVLGATWCVGISAVGSLKEEFIPGHVVIPDQFIDKTVNRVQTFFGEGVAAHIPFADPFCPVLRHALYEVSDTLAKSRNIKAHNGGTYVCMEGPAFSTRAESKLHRQWGGSLIAMTGLPEARLAREAEIAYATLGLVTDYDCWRSEDSDVDIVEILRTVKKNTEFAKAIIEALCPVLEGLAPSKLAADALAAAIVTRPELIPEKRKVELAPLIGRYIS